MNYLLEHLFVAARARAYQLADTGRFARWPDLAGALALEGHAQIDIERLASDRGAQVLLVLRMLAAKQTHRT